MVLFLLLLPAACIGWEANLGHLRTWARKVVANQNVDREHGFHLDSISNQSLFNAAHLLSAQLRGKAVNRADYGHWLVADTEIARRRAADHAARRVVHVARGVLLALLGLLVLLSGVRGGLAVRTATLGLACLAIPLISPLAWGHYYVLALPALLAVPAWLAGAGHPRAALLLPAVAAIATWTHYVAMARVGPYGLLGLSTCAWFTVACALAVKSLWQGAARAELSGSAVGPTERRHRALQVYASSSVKTRRDPAHLPAGPHQASSPATGARPFTPGTRRGPNPT